MNAPNSQADSLRAEKLRVLFGSFALSLSGTLVLTAITGVVLWDHRSQAIVAAWLMAQLIVCGWRAWLLRRYRRTDPNDGARAAKQYRSLIASTLCVGATWGSSTTMLLPLDDIYGTFIPFMMAGVCSASAVSLGADRFASRAFFIPVIAPLALLLLMQPEHSSRAMGLMTLMYGALLWGNTRTAHRQFTENFKLRRETDESQSRLGVANAQLNGLLNAATQVSIITTDLHGTITTFNRGAEMILGYKATEVIGRHTPQILHVESEAMARGAELAVLYGKPVEGFDVFVHSARHGQPEERVWTYVRKDGSKRTVNLIVSAVHNNDGLLIGFLGIATDITDRNRVQAALNEQHDLLSKLSDRVPGMIFQSRRHADGRSILHYTSEGVHEVYEVDPQDATGDLTLVRSRINPLDAGRVTTTLDEAIAQRRLWSCDYRVTLPKRGARWLHGEAIPQMQPDGSVLLYGHITDITERKNAEEHLQRLSDRMEIAAQSLEIGVWDLDLKTNSYVLNDRIYEIYGVSRDSVTEVAEELMRRIHPDDRKAVLKKHYAAIAAASRFDAQFRIIRPDGQERVIRSTALVIVDDTGTAVRMTGVNWDITELKKAERMKSEFVSTVSHELRTPLTSIQGSLGLLYGGVAGVMPEAARKLIEVARRNSDRLTLLINDLLDMEKIEAGKLHFDMTQQPAMPLIEQSMEANAGYAVTHQVQFKLTQSAPGAHIRVDANRFLQVMANLLSNAAKFSPTHGEVEISALVTAAGGMRIEVRDHGPGIPESFRVCIFQKFCQADATDARSKSGTGLGLAISKAIVEGMGGHIGFETQIGVGTMFYFELPLMAEDLQQAC